MVSVATDWCSASGSFPGCLGSMLIMVVRDHYHKYVSEIQYQLRFANEKLTKNLERLGKSTGCSSRGASFNPSAHTVAPQLSISPGTRALRLLSGLSGHRVLMIHRHTFRQTLTHEIKMKTSKERKYEMSHVRAFSSHCRFVCVVSCVRERVRCLVPGPQLTHHHLL